MSYLLLRKDLDYIENFPNFEYGNWMQNDAFQGIEKLLMKGFNRSPFEQLFDYFQSKNIDTGLFINDSDPDVDTFEQGKFLYLTQSDIFILLKYGYSNITYGLGFDVYKECELIHFENEIMKILKKFKYESIEKEKNKFYGIGMQGNQVSFSLNFNFLEYFDLTEIIELKKMMNSWNKNS